MQENKLTPWAIDNSDDLGAYKVNILLKELIHKNGGSPHNNNMRKKINVRKSQSRSRKNKFGQIQNKNQINGLLARSQYPQNITQIGFNPQQKSMRKKINCKQFHGQKPRNSMFLKRNKNYIDDYFYQNHSKNRAKRKSFQRKVVTQKNSQIYDTDIDRKIDKFLPKKMRTLGSEQKIGYSDIYQKTMHKFGKVENALSIQRKIFLLKNRQKSNNQSSRISKNQKRI